MGRSAADRLYSYELPQIVREVVEAVPEAVELPIREALPVEVIPYMLRVFRKAYAAIA